LVNDDGIIQFPTSVPQYNEMKEFIEDDVYYKSLLKNQPCQRNVRMSDLKKSVQGPKRQTVPDTKQEPIKSNNNTHIHIVAEDTYDPQTILNRNTTKDYYETNLQEMDIDGEKEIPRETINKALFDRENPIIIKSLVMEHEDINKAEKKVKVTSNNLKQSSDPTKMFECESSLEGKFKTKEEIKEIQKHTQSIDLNSNITFDYSFREGENNYFIVDDSQKIKFHHFPLNIPQDKSNLTQFCDILSNMKVESNISNVGCIVFDDEEEIVCVAGEDKHDVEYEKVFTLKDGAR